MGIFQTFKKISILKISLFVVILFSFSAFAQDEGLYPDPPPADAAFVRVVNAFQNTESDEARAVKVGDRDYAELAFGEASDYYVVLQGEHEIVTGDTRSTSEILAGRFYTVVLSELKAVIEESAEISTEISSEISTEESAEETAEETSDSEDAVVEVMTEEGVLNISLVEDPSNSNRAKTLLTLYNLSSSEAVDLKTADGSVDVILGVAPLSVGNIAVNPISVDLASFRGEEQISEYAGLRLERGAVYSAIVMDDGSAEDSNSLISIWVLTKTVLDND